MNPLVLAGIACIIAAIVGGGFKGLGLELPVIGSLRRQLLLALCGAILVAVPLGVSSYQARCPGDPQAQLTLGLASYDSANYSLALHNFSCASRAGLPEATYHLGEMLYHGEGVVPDKLRGIKLDQEAAKAGFAPAQAALAIGYLEGDHLPVDSEQARLWASRSSEQQDPVGQFVYALLQRVDRDKLALLELSAKEGYAPAQSALAYASFQAVRNKELPRASGALTALSWLRRAADQGDPVAEFMVGRLALRQGAGELALMWLTIADHPVSRIFRPMNDSVRQQAVRLRDSLEGALLPDSVITARNEAAAWQPRLERPYRHGH